MTQLVQPAKQQVDLLNHAGNSLLLAELTEEIVGKCVPSVLFQMDNNSFL